jgi:hypothetical protein
LGTDILEIEATHVHFPKVLVNGIEGKKDSKGSWSPHVRRILEVAEVKPGGSHSPQVK